ncbi:Meiotically up-regulated protein 136 [Ceratocystis platani]|uniref:Meiotically up-regulated protein 136 n=1 Tax=Ceratocystis fimbriata f. sp. platani TaxID=88771 RepID=A0A0F8CUG9_CERFI|nr:Meiotically up-regulated protein 136 [Ceratocystis platani]
MAIQPYLLFRRRNGSLALLAVVLLMIIFSQINMIPSVVEPSLWVSFAGPPLSPPPSSQAHHGDPTISKVKGVSPMPGGTSPKEEWVVKTSLILPQFEYPAILTEDYALQEGEEEADTTEFTPLRPVTDKSKLAIVTFLDNVINPSYQGGSDSDDDGDDHYFTNVRMLTYQLLHDNKTAIRGRRRPYITFVVAVTSRVSASKRARLAADGADVVEVADIPGSAGLNTGDVRWAHAMSKLRVFEWVQYTRVLFLDADTVLRGPVDDLFYTFGAVYPQRTNHARAPQDQPRMPNEFAFVAQPDLAYLGNLERLYPDDPMLTAGYFNAGFWLAAPDKRMFEYLISLIDMKARPFNTNLPEQNLLNYAFRHCDYFQDQHLHCKTGGPLGPMPWMKADTLWSSNRPTLKDYAFGVRALHYKGWETPTSSPLRTLWEEIRNQTVRALGS